MTNRVAVVATAPKAYRRHRERVTIDETTGCWLYRSPQSERGRPRITVQGLDMEAYTYFWLVHRRKEVPPGMVLRHLCGRGEDGCVNPDHLVIGTYSENNQDAVRDGTWANQWTRKET